MKLKKIIEKQEPFIQYNGAKKMYYKYQVENMLNELLKNLVDEQVKKLSKIQVELSQADISPDDFNKISEMINKFKEQLINY